MNKIGWCNLTWNPVWGCNNHCEYCYARGIAKRFWRRIWMNEANQQWKEHPIWAWTGDHLEGLIDFKPTWLEAQFKKKFPKKPQRIFVGSMSELKYWKPEWIRDTLDKILEYPQHTFQFLTKFPDIYSQWYFHPNCWLGVTITKNDNTFNGIYDFLRRNDSNIKYLSFEPLLENILDYKLSKYFDWVIIGAETGNRKGKVIPKKQWVWDIVRYCQTNNIPVYIKDSIGKLYSQFGGIKEFPNLGDKK